MKKNRKRLLWAAILLLLFLPPCYYLKSSFVDRKAELERESLLVRKQISKPVQPAEVERERIGPAFPSETFVEEADITLVEVPVETRISEQTRAEKTREARRRELEARIRKLKQELLAKDRTIEGWKGRWEEKSKELERYKRELMALRKETVRKERKLLAKKPPVTKEERREPEVKGKWVVPPLMAAALGKCAGVPISHRNLALFLGKGLHLGSNLSYDQASVALHGLGISPGAGWNQGDPSFPIGADELVEVLYETGKAISDGLVAADYSELTKGLREYCKRELARLGGVPQCEGPRVTECVGCEISRCDFAVYLCRVLGIGEALDCDQSFVALAALGISPRGGWRVDEPYDLITQREIEEVRCSVQEAYEKGCIETGQVVLVAAVNDYCLWLKMNVGYVGEITVPEAMALSDYLSGGRIPIPKGGEVASGSQ
jgi:hypothetical protein